MPKQIQIHTSHLKAYWTAASLLKTGMYPEALVGQKASRTTGCMRFAMDKITRCSCAGQVIDFKGAAFLVDQLPRANYLLADKSYDTDRFR